LDDIDFGTATARLGAQKAPHLILGGVEVSVRPEVTLHSKSKSGEDLVGGIRLHFPKTEPMDEEQANLVSAPKIILERWFAFPIALYGDRFSRRESLSRNQVNQAAALKPGITQ
jgi:hypothetical protein